jgi:hypothetical protein
MQMRMIEQLLPPGVQHGEEADLGTEVLGIGGDRTQGLRGRAEQDVVDGCLVVIGDRRDRLRHGEHDVEIRRVQQLGTAALQPGRLGQGLALRAVTIAAGVVCNTLVAARVTLCGMTAERYRSA